MEVEKENQQQARREHKQSTYFWTGGASITLDTPWYSVPYGPGVSPSAFGVAVFHADEAPREQRPQLFCERPVRSRAIC